MKKKRKKYIFFVHLFRPFMVSSKLINFEKNFIFNHLSKGFWKLFVKLVFTLHSSFGKLSLVWYIAPSLVTI